MKPRPLDELLAAAQEAERLEQEARAARLKVGQHVKSIRRSAGLTQSSFAAMLDKSQPYLSQIENGDRTPSTPTVNAIAAFASSSLLHDAAETSLPDIKDQHAKKEEDSSNE